MGSDIHMYVEKRNKETGKWEILNGENKWTKRDREQVAAGVKDNTNEREVQWWKNRVKYFEELDSSETLKRVLKEADAEHLYFEGMQNGSFDIGFFKEKLTEEQFEKLDLYDLENAFKLEADFTNCGRNYDAFAILADVRNGSGLAGVRTGGGFNIISEPKVIPLDASDYFLWKAEQWNGDGHSFSYLTVKELKEFDWTQVTEKTGLVSLLPGEYSFCKSYVEMKEDGEEIPKSYFGGGSGLEIPKEQADRLYEKLNGDYSEENLIKWFPPISSSHNKTINVRLNWNEDYKEAFSGYYEELLENIPSMYPEAADDEIRYVFFFDN